MEKLSAILIIIVALLSCTKNNHNRLIGSWLVDEAATEQNIMTSPQWSEMSTEEKAMFPEVISEMSINMMITFTSKTIVTDMVGRISEVPYRISTASDSLFILQATTENGDVQLTIRLFENGGMQFSSEANDDMTYYIWKKKS